MYYLRELCFIFYFVLFSSDGPELSSITNSQELASEELRSYKYKTFEDANRLKLGGQYAQIELEMKYEFFLLYHLYGHY